MTPGSCSARGSRGKRRRVLGCTQPTVPRSPELGLSFCHWGTRWPLVRKHSDKWKAEGNNRQGQMPQGQTGCLILSARSLPVPTVQRPVIPDLSVSTGWEECDPACAAHPAPTRAASFVMCRCLGSGEGWVSLAPPTHLSRHSYG